jgi:tRNA(Arg) A34 adenosine deaminase TadA
MEATRCITVLNLVRSMTPIGMPFIYSEYRRSKRMDREFHEVYMKMALKEAEKAGARGEVPVGAILLKGDEVLAKDHNRCVELSDPTAHAEILVLRKGGEILGNYRLNGTAMYVTAEPCPMCVSAMVHGRISRLIFGSFEPKFGAVESKFRLLNDNGLNHKVKVERGILEKECAEILKVFFKQRRKL